VEEQSRIMQRSLPTRLDLPARMAPDETDYGQRHFVNLVAAVFLLFIAVLITWTLGAVTEGEKQMRCVESGRIDCVAIAAPPRGMRAATH
jgi:hypothetical protein